MLFLLDILSLWATVSIRRYLSKYRTPPPFPATPSPYNSPGFHQVCLLFHKKCFINLFHCSNQIIAKNNAFSKKNKFFLSTLCWLVLILLFCFYVLHTVFFHHSAIKKLRIKNLSFPWLPIWPFIKSHDKTKEFMLWKLQAVVVSSVSEETKFEVDTTSLILRYIYHFGNVKKIII